MKPEHRDDRAKRHSRDARHGDDPSGVYQFCLTASSETRPRRTLVRMSSAVAVQTKGLGSLLWASR